MNKLELASKLEEMYGVPGANKAAMVHLFGIIYADEIKMADTNSSEIVRLTDLSYTYKAEINKGIKLAKYVDVKAEYKERFK